VGNRVPERVYDACHPLGHESDAREGKGLALREDAESAAVFHRRPWDEGPLPAAEGMLAMADDELLHHIEGLPADHELDESLLLVVRSSRHFFIRQEAAKKVRDARLLLDYAEDRHVGQILARRMSRVEDVDYLERLVAGSQHLDVRKSAQAQLARLRQHLDGRCGQGPESAPQAGLANPRP
jgi:hypothetical protein